MKLNVHGNDLSYTESVINILQSDFLTQGPQVPLLHTMAIEQQDKVIAILRKVLQ